MPRSERPRRKYVPPMQDPMQEVLVFHQELVQLHNNGIQVAGMAVNFVRNGGICDRNNLLQLLNVLNTHVQQFKLDLDQMAVAYQEASHINGNDRHAKALELGMRYQEMIGIWTENVLPIISTIQSVINFNQQGVVGNV